MRHRELVFQVLIEQECERRRIMAVCAEDVASWDAGALLWLTKHTRTEDTHWLAKGTNFLERFPRKEYLRVVMGYLLSESALFIIKSREMLMSWLVTGYITWMCTTKPVFAVAQTGVPREAMLYAYTRNAARALDEQDRIGSIAPGKQADFALLDRDVLTVTAEEARDTKVLWTIVGGKTVYGARP